MPTTNTGSNYRSGITGELFSSNIVKVIMSANSVTMMLKMDSIHRTIILSHSILLPEELHIVRLMIKNAELSVKVDEDRAGSFKTSVAKLQGSVLA